MQANGGARRVGKTALIASAVSAFVEAFSVPESKMPDETTMTKRVQKLVPLSSGHIFVFKTTKGARHRSQRIRANRRKAKR